MYSKRYSQGLLSWGMKTLHIQLAVYLELQTFNPGCCLGRQDLMIVVLSFRILLNYQLAAIVVWPLPHTEHVTRVFICLVGDIVAAITKKSMKVMSSWLDHPIITPALLQKCLLRVVQSRWAFLVQNSSRNALPTDGALRMSLQRHRHLHIRGYIFVATHFSEAVTQKDNGIAEKDINFVSIFLYRFSLVCVNIFKADSSGMDFLLPPKQQMLPQLPWPELISSSSSSSL